MKIIYFYLFTWKQSCSMKNNSIITVQLQCEINSPVKTFSICYRINHISSSGRCLLKWKQYWLKQITTEKPEEMKAERERSNEMMERWWMILMPPNTCPLDPTEQLFSPFNFLSFSSFFHSPSLSFFFSFLTTLQEREKTRKKCCSLALVTCINGSWLF